jgi:uncharacterized OsmC-like protein
MNSEQLRAMQAPLKARYREHPEDATITLRARARLDDAAVACKVETGQALVTAGLHPATGGDGLAACSGDMLLEALAACAGVTLRAVATALDIPIQGGTVNVAKEQPVGFKEIRLRFDLDTQAPAEQVSKLLSLTERYCVVYQTLRQPPPVKFA